MVDRRQLIKLSAFCTASLATSTAGAVAAVGGGEGTIEYATGIRLTRSTQIVRYQGNIYRAKETKLPFVTTTWEVDSSNLVVVGDSALREELADPRKGAEMVGRSAVSVGIISELLVQPHRSDLVFMVRGANSPDDGGGGQFVWVDKPTRPDNVYTFARDDGASGVFLRIPDRREQILIEWGSYGVTDDAVAANRVAAHLAALPREQIRPEVVWARRLYPRGPINFAKTNIKKFGGVFSPGGESTTDRQNGSSVIDLTQYTAGPGTIALTLPNGWNGGEFLVQGSGDYRKDPIGVYCPNMLPCEIARISFRDLHNWNFLALRCSDPRFVQLRCSDGGAAINRKSTADMTFSVNHTTLTASSRIFDAEDVGREFVCGTHATTIISYESPTQVKIADVAPISLSKQLGCFGLIRCTTTAGSNIVVFEREWLTSADVGRLILLDGAGIGRTPIWTRIVSVISGTTCTLLDPAAVTSSRVQLWIASIGILPNLSDSSKAPAMAPNGWSAEDCVVERSNGPAWAVYGRAAEMSGNIKAYVEAGKCASAVLIWNPTSANLVFNTTGGGRRHTKIVGSTGRATIRHRSGAMPSGDFRPFLIDVQGSGNELTLVPPAGMQGTEATLFEITPESAKSGFDSRCLKVDYQPIGETLELRSYWRKADLKHWHRERYQFAASNGYVIDSIAPNLAFLNTPLQELTPAFHFHFFRLLVSTSQWAAMNPTNHYNLVISSSAHPGSDLVYQLHGGSGSFTEEGASSFGKSVYTYPNITRFGRHTIHLVAVGEPSELSDIKMEMYYMLD